MKPATFSRDWYLQFSGPYSAPVEPFRIRGNIHYVGGANIASYLITTPQGHILLDTRVNEMHDGIRDGVVKLGFKASDIRIMLSSHAHFDHIEGHAAMKRLTGAQVIAMKGDAEALESGTRGHLPEARGGGASEAGTVSLMQSAPQAAPKGWSHKLDRRRRS
jgi:metallo-beta-lactamase class B